MVLRLRLRSDKVISVEFLVFYKSYITFNLTLKTKKVHVLNDGLGKTVKEKKSGSEQNIFLTQFFCQEIGVNKKSKQLIIS